MRVIQRRYYDPDRVSERPQKLGEKLPGSRVKQFRDA